MHDRPCSRSNRRLFIYRDSRLRVRNRADDDEPEPCNKHAAVAQGQPGARRSSAHRSPIPPGECATALTAARRDSGAANVLRSIAGRENSRPRACSRTSRSSREFRRAASRQHHEHGLRPLARRQLRILPRARQVGSRRQGREEHRAAHVRDGADDQSRLHVEGAERPAERPGRELHDMPPRQSSPDGTRRPATWCRDAPAQFGD